MWYVIIGFFMFWFGFWTACLFAAAQERQGKGEGKDDFDI